MINYGLSTRFFERLTRIALLRSTLTLIGVLIVLVCTSLEARALDALRPLETSSPKDTLSAFQAEFDRLEAAYTVYRSGKSVERAQTVLRSLHKLQRLFDLSEVPPATRGEVGGASVVMLADILHRFPRIDSTVAPDDDETARWRIPDTDIVIKRLAEGPRAGEFLFSAETVARLPDFHAIAIAAPTIQSTHYADWRMEQVRFTGPVFSYGLLANLPAFLQVLAGGAPIWKVALVVLLYIAILSVIGFWMRYVARRTVETSPSMSRLWQITSPLLLAIALFSIQRFVRLQINLSGVVSQVELTLNAALLALALAWLVWQLGFLVAEAIIASPRVPEDSYDAHLLRLVARVVGVLGAGGVLVFGAHEIGIPALGLVAGVGVGGFALALAAQSTVENLFGGVSIFADRPFRVGDFIGYGGGSGTVEAIGPRSSRIRSLDGTLTTVPNGDLARMHVVNYSARDKCMFNHVVGVRYETSPDQLEWIASMLRGVIGAHDLVEESPGFPRVRVVGFGASSIDIEVRAFVLTNNYSEFLHIQEELLLEVVRVIERCGSGFAFPSTTAYLTRDGGLDAHAKAVAERAGRRLKGRDEEEEHPDDAEGPDAPATDVLR